MPRRKLRRPPEGDGAVATRTRPGKNNPGHPPVIADPARVAAMLNAVRAGVPITAACHHSGVSTSSHARAMDAGRQAAELLDTNPDATLTERQELYREYRDQVLRARATVAGVNVGLVAQAARGGSLVSRTTRRYRNEQDVMVTETTEEYARPVWQAARFLLQTSFREDFGTQRAQVEVTGAGGGPVQVGGDDVLRSIAERVRQVQERQAQELPGGWDPPVEDYDDGNVYEGEVMDDGDDT